MSLSGREQARKIVVYADLPRVKEENTLHITGPIPKQWPYEYLWTIAVRAISAAMELGCAKIQIHRGVHERTEFHVIDLITKGVIPVCHYLPRRPLNQRHIPRLAVAGYLAKGDQVARKTIYAAVPSISHVPFVGPPTGKGV